MPVSFGISFVDPQFGRCSYFLLVDTEGERFEALKNTSTSGGNAVRRLLK